MGVCFGTALKGVVVGLILPLKPPPQGGVRSEPRTRGASGLVIKNAAVRLAVENSHRLCLVCYSTELGAFGVQDSETQGRYGHDIGVNTASTPITTANIAITTVEPVTTASAPITTAGVSVSTVEPSTPPTITTTTDVIEEEDLIIAQTLMKMRKASETATRPTVPPPQIDPKDKGKGIIQEHEKLVKVKGKDQIEYDADVAQRLQEKLDKEVRIEREREEEASKASNITEWDDVQAMMDADYELATKLQAKEQGEISIEERSKLFVELMNERKKHFARLRAEEWIYTAALRGYSFDEIKTLFETTMRKVNTFVPIESEVDRAVPELAAGSSKRAAEEELDQESSKRQKTGESSELAEEPRDKEADELSQEELQQMMIIVPEQGMNVEALQTKYPIIDWEIYTEGTRKYWKIIRVGNHTEVELKRLFEPDIDDELWKLQKHIHDLTWKLYDSCGVHHVSTEKGIDIYMLVEKEYPLSRGTLTLMLVAKLLVDQDNEMLQRNS
ncbi:hypothetical protein Tco_0025176 [Tanacetum coccineum]